MGPCSRLLTTSRGHFSDRASHHASTIRDPGRTSIRGRRCALYREIMCSTAMCGPAFATHVPRSIARIQPGRSANRTAPRLGCLYLARRHEPGVLHPSSRGRARNPSSEILEALARALFLGAAEREHLNDVCTRAGSVPGRPDRRSGYDPARSRHSKRLGTCRRSFSADAPTSWPPTLWRAPC